MTILYIITGCLFAMIHLSTAQDECQLGTHNCNVNAECTDTANSFTCTCKEGYLGNGTSCDEGTHKVECDENFMIIYLDSRIQTSDTSLITLRDASCTAKLYAPSNQYGLSTTYDKCGTTKKETATHILYENEVTWIFGNDTSGVIRHGGKKINFTCSIDRYQNVSFLSLAPTTSFLTGKEDGYGTFTVSLTMHTTQEFNSSVTAFPAVVALNQRVYFEARIGSNDSDIFAMIEKCTASPTTNRDDPSSYPVILNRCTHDPTTQFHNVKENHQVQFSFTAFAFNTQLDTVYLHCQLFMCHIMSIDSRCLTSCQRYVQNRYRKSASDSLPAKRMQRREASNVEYAPSKTYTVSIGPLKPVRNCDDGNSKGTTGQTFGTVQGLALGISILGAIVIAFLCILIVICLRRRRKSHTLSEKLGAGNGLGEGSMNQTYELS